MRKMAKRALSFVMAVLMGATAMPVFAAENSLETIDIKAKLDAYNVSWNTPGANSSDSMPIGNGDITANVWLENKGDLCFYIGKSDAWSEATRLLKVGKVRVRLSPNPFLEGTEFLQVLKLHEGEIVITAGAKENQVNLRIWVDANHPVIHVEACGEQDFDMEVSTEIYRDEVVSKPAGNRGDFNYNGVAKGPFTPTEAPDIVLEDTDTVMWCHRNEYSLFDKIVEGQHVESLDIEDPYLGLTFGACIKSSELQRKDNTTMTSPQAGRTFSFAVYPYTSQTESVEQWKGELENQVSAVEQTEITDAYEAHLNWWEDFWNRSYIFVSGDAAAETVTRGYILQRYMQAIQGRGAYPIKFNGGTINFDYMDYDADSRQWGPAYWFQNTRHLYWNMLAAGDFDMMQPLFEMYMEALDVQKQVTMTYYGHEGAFFPETMNFFGLYIGDDFGWNNQGTEPTNEYVRYYWQSGLELSTMMCEYYNYTKDTRFAEETLLPFAGEVIKFYDNHYERVDGVLNITPAHVLETYWEDVLNPVEVVAGLDRVLSQLMQLPESMYTQEQFEAWESLYEALPEIPVGTDENGNYIEPAEQYNPYRHNIENPELYVVFPYKQYGVGKADLDTGINTYNRKQSTFNNCWSQNGIQAAYLGLSGEAKNAVVSHFSQIPGNVRFPAYWSVANDWMPDLDNGGSAMMALQAMLMQCDGDKVLVFPAWPDEWDVEFKLYAQDNTVVSGTRRDGVIEFLDVDTEEENLDVEVVRPIPEPVNVAKGILPTSNSDACQLVERITNGAVDGNFSECGSGPVWIQLDLGQAYNIDNIKLWHYFQDGRTYQDVIVQVSNDPEFKEGVTTVFNNDGDNSVGQGIGTDLEYAESGAGKDIAFETVNARYVRCWSNGSSVDEKNHYIELEVYTTVPELHLITAESFENGTVDILVGGIESKKAFPKETVSLFIKPDEGYRLKENSLQVNNGVITITPGENSVYTFVMPDQDVAITAEFEKIPEEPEAPDYDVELPRDIQNGTITADKLTAKAGETVTLTVKADDGYMLKEGSLKVNNGAVEVTAGANGTYVFEMPEGGATITAEFVKEEVENPGENPGDNPGENPSENPGEDQKKPDKQKLSLLIAEVDKLDLSKYTDESVKTLKEALAKAKAVMADNNLTSEGQQQVDDAAKLLQEAKDGLKLKDTGDANKTPTDDKEDVPTPGKTGDESNLLVPGLLMCLAVAGAGITWGVARKKKENRA